MSRYSFTESDVIYLHAQEKKTISEISRILGCSVSPIRRILKSNNCLVNYSDRKVEDANICSLYESGISSIKISKMFNITPRRVVNILEKNGIQIRVVRSRGMGIKKKFICDSKEWLETQHIALKKSLSQIESEYKISKHKLQYFLLKYGIPHHNYHLSDCNLSKSELEHQHLTLKKSPRKIGSDHGVSAFVILKKLKEYNIQHLDYKLSQSSVYNSVKNDSEWIKNNYESTNKSVATIAQEIGIGPTQLSREFHKCGITTKHKRGFDRRSSCEYKLESFFENAQIPFITSYLLPNKKTLDFYLPKHNIGIEINGCYFHSYNPYSSISGIKNLLHIREKQVYCESLGITVFEFYDYEIERKYEILVSLLCAKLNLYKSRLFARNGIIKRIDVESYSRFFNETHLQGSSRCSVAFGLFNDGELVSVMGFSKCRFRSDCDYELVRFANRKDTLVIGAASKIFSHFLRCFGNVSVLSYSDNRYSLGRLYKTLGFLESGQSKPSYYWVKGRNVYHRQKFQKKKIVNLPEYDPFATEKENMWKHGYRILYNCGNKIFIYRK